MLSNINRPANFNDYVGQDSVINYVKQVVKHNKHANGILLSGPSGCGKTTLAHLYVKATLCENRSEGSYEPCGTCNSCTSDIEKGEHPNVTYYRITEASLFKEAVSDIIDISKSRPAITHDKLRSDNLHRFIILDEVQLATRQSISPFLDSLEFAAEGVTVILVTMDLNKMDPTVRDAIESRCIELTLSKLSPDNIKAKFKQVYPNLTDEVANLISFLSKGNLRKAWSILQFFNSQHNDCGDISVNEIVESKFGGFDSNLCNHIIYSLEHNSWNDTKLLFDSLYDNEETAIDFFLSHLTNLDLSEEGINLISSLSHWLQSNYKIPLLSIFKLFQNKSILFKETPTFNKELEETITPIKKVVVSNPNDKLSVSKTILDISSQLSKITNDKVISSNSFNLPCLLFTSWKEYINKYDNNN